MFKKLLVPLDRSPLAEEAIGPATALALASHADLDVVLVHQPIPFGGFGDAPWNDEQRNDEHRYLESITREIGSGAVVKATYALLDGSPVEMIGRRAHDIGADLIVLTSHGRTGISRAWLGSVADGLLRHSTVPVLMLRPVENPLASRAAKHLFKHVLVPLDGSSLSEDILAPATELAACAGARVTLLRVVEPVPLILLEASLPFAYPPTVRDPEATARLVNEAKKQLDELARRVQTGAQIAVSAAVVEEGSAAHAILDYARTHEADVIAMSTHGRGASRLVMGSVADKVVRGGGVPVLLSCPVGLADERPVLTPSSVTEQLPALAGT
jgi:nucleotide-binding universal stress UspA family protein